MDFVYYIGKNKIYEKKDLQTDKFIFKTKEPIPYIGINGDFEGPYKNLYELSKNSKFYKELHVSNPRTASKLIHPKKVHSLKKSMLIPKGKTFDINLYYFLNHILHPNFINEEVSGLHFFNRENMKIHKIHAKNTKEVLDADVSKFDKEINRWLKKRTTLFPLNWNEGNLLAELEIAYLYRFELREKKSQFAGITPNGIKVIFIFSNGKPKTAYPIL